MEAGPQFGYCLVYAALLFDQSQQFVKRDVRRYDVEQNIFGSVKLIAYLYVVRLGFNPALCKPEVELLLSIRGRFFWKNF